jgi:phosphoserine phosphatase RsbX
MNLTIVQNHELLDWAVASRPVSGEAVSGDLHFVEPLDHGVLLAVIDGLGHGVEATNAAQAAAAVLNENAREPVIALLNRCHTELTNTRGVVMTIAFLHAPDDTITWLGVGNVEGRLLRSVANTRHPPASVLLRNGVVGYQMPVLYPSVIPIAAGDLLILATDGIQPAFAEGINRDETPQRIADGIMARHFRGNDDALVLVGRYRGFPHE